MLNNERAWKLRALRYAFLPSSSYMLLELMEIFFSLIGLIVRRGYHFTVHAIFGVRPAPFCVCVDMAFCSSRARSNGTHTPNPKYRRFGTFSTIESSF